MRKKRESDDQALMQFSRSRKAFFVEYVCAVLLISLLIAASVKGFKLSNILILIPLGIAGYSIAYAELSKYVHRATITPSKILIIDGLIKVRKRHVFISVINDVDTKQDYFQRLCGFGNIHIRTASGENLELKDVNNPEIVMAKIEELMLKNSR